MKYHSNTFVIKNTGSYGETNVLVTIKFSIYSEKLQIKKNLTIDYQRFTTQEILYLKIIQMKEILYTGKFFLKFSELI